MKRAIACAVLLLCALAPRASAAAQDPAPRHERGAAEGPTIELPPEAEGGSEPEPAVRVGSEPLRDEELVRGLMQERQEGATVIGGYGEVNAGFLRRGLGGRFDGHATLRRLVLFVAHNFDEHFRAYAELEWENAVTENGADGAVEVEQAFIDWKVLGERLGVRAGLVLVPMGIVNQWHEPPVFHGVERPFFDRLIIPSTWRELAIGAFGRVGMLRWEAYAMTSLDPLRFDVLGIASSLQRGSLAKLDSIAFSARAEIEPMLGLVLGLSGYFTDAGGNGHFVNASGGHRPLVVPVIGWSFDARLRRWGFEARAVWAQFFLPESDALMRSLHDDNGAAIPTYRDAVAHGDLASGPIPSRTQGGYVELAYDVLRPFDLGTHQLLPFLRLEYYDTQAGVPTGYGSNETRNVQELTAGLSYRPIPQIVAKADLQLRDRHRGQDELQINFGFGYMF